MSKLPANPVNNISEDHKLHGLDHLRALAIIAVLCFHYQFFGRPAWESGSISAFGWTGVDLFFVLSGFLISGQLFNAIAKGRPISPKKFFIKRFFRIIPPYLLVLIIYLSIPGAREWGQLSPTWKYFTFTVNFGQDFRKYGTFSHSWSLCVEEQFYLILPLTFWVISYFKGGKKAIYVVAALFLFGVIVRYLSWEFLVEPYLGTNDFGARWNEYMYYPTYNRLDGLLVGVNIAGLFTFYPGVKEWVNRKSYFILLGGIILLVAAFFICKQYASYNTAIYGFPVISLGYGLVLAAFVSPSNIFFRIKSKVTSIIATLSYAVYLSHKIIIHLVQNLLEKFGMDKNSVLAMLICAACIVAVALAMRYVIEKPALKLRNRILAKRKIQPVSEPL